MSRIEIIDRILAELRRQAARKDLLVTPHNTEPDVRYVSGLIDVDALARAIRDE